MVMTMKNNELANLISNFFTLYLKGERKYSDNTYFVFHTPNDTPNERPAIQKIELEDIFKLQNK